MKTIIEMAREAGFPFNKFGLLQGDDDNEIDADAMLEHFAELVRADERNSWPAEMEAMERQVNILTDALAEQPAPVPWSQSLESVWAEHHDPIGEAQDKLIAEQAAQAQQEPVAWMYQHPNNHLKTCYQAYKPNGECTPLYTTPQPAREPLTNLEGLKLAYNHHWLNNRAGVDAYLLGIRDAEAAHNIKENQS